MSNTFDPTAFETAISPYPSLITAIELNASGIDTPAATNVKPIFRIKNELDFMKITLKFRICS